MSSLNLRHFSKGISAVALAGFLLAPAAVRAQVPISGAAVKQAVKLDELGSLKSALTLLEGANHDYKGHRAKAVHAIHAAIHEIEHHGQKHVPTPPAVAAAKAAAKASTPKLGSVPPVHENQVASDTQLVAAEQLLSKVFAELTATGKHPKAIAHVQLAVQELQIALKIL
jgi:hypothetical protein